jgi:hypothetical protein
MQIQSLKKNEEQTLRSLKNMILCRKQGILDEDELPLRRELYTTSDVIQDAEWNCARHRSRRCASSTRAACGFDDAGAT